MIVNRRDSMGQQIIVVNHGVSHYYYLYGLIYCEYKNVFKSSVAQNTLEQTLHTLTLITKLV